MSTSGFGPADLYVIAFPDDRLPERVTWALIETLAEGIVTLLDLTLVVRRTDGSIEVVELERIGDGVELTVVEAGATGLIGQDDIDAIAADLDPGTSALVVLIEHTWARRLRGAIEDAGADVLSSERFPGWVLDEVATAAGLDTGSLTA